MNTLRLALKGILPLIVLAAGILAAKALIDSYEEPVPEPVVIRPPLVTAVRAELSSLTLAVQAEGTVAPRTESQLVPEVSGQVTEVSPSLAAGGFFAAGDVLLRIDRRFYELAAVRAKAAIEQSRLRLATERQESEIARREWDRLGSGEPSPLLVREPQISDALAALAAAEAALAQAEHDLEHTVIRAPFAGRVRSKQVDMGQFVQRGAPLATIYSVDVAEVRLPIPNAELEYCNLPLGYRDASSASEGPPVRLTTRFAGREHTWHGRIVRTEGEIDPRTRMVVAVAQVQDPYARGRDRTRPPLKVGMFVQAEIQGIRVRDIVRLPRTALRGENLVYVVDAGGRLRFRTVDILRRERDAVLIRDGIADGERICMSPLEAAVDGMAVDTVDASGGAPASSGPGAEG